MEIDFVEEEGLRKGLTAWSKWICTDGKQDTRGAGWWARRELEAENKETTEIEAYQLEILPRLVVQVWREQSLSHGWR